MSGSKPTSSDSPDSVDEALVEILAACEEVPEGGGEPARADGVESLGDSQTVARLRELRSVIELLDKASESTAPPGSDGAIDPFAAEDAAEDSLAAPPDRMGRFRIERELGRGGCGIVFLAMDEALGRRVALKVPRPELLVSPELRQRFLREAKASGLVDHPNIVPVYEVGDDGPVCHIASAYCEGPTLVEWLKDQDAPIDPALAASWIGSLADAAQHAHSRGVYHRDIKPGNVLLEPRADDTCDAKPPRHGPPRFVPRLTDFGLAKLQEGCSVVSKDGAVIGTPAYMAPEQAEGHHDAIGPATDVYALGAVLYELLTGRSPFRGDTELETLRLIVSTEPTPLHVVRPDIPPDLAAICLKCLEKSPRSRYASARAMSDDIERFLQGRETLARPIRWWHRGLRWTRRKPAAAALVAVTILATLTIGIGGWWSSVRYQRALETSRRQLYLSDVRLAHQAWKSRDTSQMIRLLSRHIASGGDADVRTFPWHYLWRLCHGEFRILEGHRGDVYAVDFSPDDTTLATAGRDGALRFWDVVSGAQVGRPIRHPDEINHVRFAPSGTLLASTCDDGKVRLWSHPGGRLLRSMTPHPPVANVVDFAPAGDVFVTCGHDPAAKVWETETGRHVGTLQGHTDWIETVCFSPQGNYLATGANDETARLWEWPGGKELARLNVGARRICAVAFSPDQSMVATAGARSAAVQLWTVPDGRCIETLDTRGVHVRNLTWSPSGDQLMATGDGESRIWEFKAKATSVTQRGPVGHIWMSRFSSQGQLLATAGIDGVVRLWDLSADVECRYLPTDAPVYAHAFSPDGGTIAVVRPNGTVSLIDVATGQLAKEIETGIRGIAMRLVFSPDGNRLAIVTGNQTITCCNVRSGEVDSTFVGENRESYAIAFSSDGTRLATGGRTGQVTIWSPSTGQMMTRLPKRDASITDLAFSPDGRQLAVASGPAVIFLDVTNWGEVAKLPHSRSVRRIAYSLDGTHLVTAGDDNTATLWDLSVHQPVVTFVGHQDRVLSVALSPQQETLATIASDGTMRLWDVGTGQEVITIPITRLLQPEVAFSPDGRSLAANVWRSDNRDGVFLLEAPSATSHAAFKP